MQEKTPIVCHLTSVHRVKDTRIYHKECASLAKNGFQVKLIALNPTSVESDYDGLEIIPVYLETPLKLLRVWRGPGALLKEAIKINAHVYHLHDPELLLIARRLQKNGAKVIYDSHEDVPKQITHKSWIPSFLKPVLSLVYQRFEHNVVRELDAIVTVVESIANRFRTIHSRVVLVKNYPIIDKAIEVGWGNRDKDLCYVGDLTEVRGVWHMVKAMEDVNATLYLGGSFSSPDLEQRVTSLSSWNKVNALGFLSRTEVIEVYQSSKIGLVMLHPTPSYVEALPVKLLEYMSMGLAVVGSDFGMIKEIVEENNCGILVNPLKEEQIAKAISELLEDPKRIELLGRNGRDAALKFFNWEEEASKLTALYKELLNKA